MCSLKSRFVCWSGSGTRLYQFRFWLLPFCPFHCQEKCLEMLKLAVVNCPVMSNSYPRDGMFNPHLTTIKDSYKPLHLLNA